LQSLSIDDATLADAPAIDELQAVYEEQFGPVPKRLERVRWRVVREAGCVLGAYSVYDALKSRRVRIILDLYVCRGRDGVRAAYAMGTEIVDDADREGLTVNGIVNPANDAMVAPLTALAFLPTGILVSRTPVERSTPCPPQSSP